jgi:hypothetical protein
LFGSGQQLKRTPVPGRNTVLPNGFPVQFSGITLVLMPLIVRVFGMKSRHGFVAMRFGQNGGRCNGRVFPIAFHHTKVRGGRIGMESIPIHQDKLRTGTQRIKRPVHGEQVKL